MLQFLEEAEKLIRINSVSQNGNEEIAFYLQQIMKTMGFKTSLQEVSHSLEGVSKRQFNLIGILGDPLVDRKTRKGLLLNTHLDTVSGGMPFHWTETGNNPFNPTIKDGKIFGLGSADVKLDFLCKLKACEKYKERRLKMPIYLVGTAAEEIGMLGAKFLIKSGVLNPRYAIVGEPSELKVIHAHKAYLVYSIGICFNQIEKDAKGYNTRIQLRCAGKSAHGSYPNLGDNAIERLFATLKKIKEANFQFRISQLGGGDLVNKVPDQAMVEFFVGSSSFEDFKRFARDSLMEQNVLIEYGGIGESGIRFLPENLLEALEQTRGALQQLKTELFTKTDETFNPSESTMNLGRIEQTRDGVFFHLDFRLLPHVSLDAFEQRLKDLVGETNQRFSNLIFKVQKKRMNPSLDLKDTNELVRTAKEVQEAVGISAGLDKKATSTEAAQYFQAGYDAIVFGPGKSHGNSHSPNEHNIIEHLDKAVHFYDRMIERFCL
ncbi:MAG: M20 family metallopeptidase [Bacteriovoracia bacterium]